MALYHLPCSLWGTVTEYVKFESVVSKMVVINDSGERALSLLDNFYNKIVGYSAVWRRRRKGPAAGGAALSSTGNKIPTSLKLLLLGNDMYF